MNVTSARIAIILICLNRGHGVYGKYLRSLVCKIRHGNITTFQTSRAGDGDLLLKKVSGILLPYIELRNVNQLPQLRYSYLFLSMLLRDLVAMMLESFTFDQFLEYNICTKDTIFCIDSTFLIMPEVLSPRES